MLVNDGAESVSDDRWSADCGPAAKGPRRTFTPGMSPGCAGWPGRSSPPTCPAGWTPTTSSNSVFRRFFQATRRDDYVAPGGEDLWDLLLVITLNRVRSEQAFQRAAKRDVRRTSTPNRRNGRREK